MATIIQPTIRFTTPAQTRVEISCQIRFTPRELRNQPTARENRYLPSFPNLALTKSRYRLKVLFQVIRAIPQPFFKGDPRPPLPDPITLNTKEVRVPLPRSGEITPLRMQFGYRLTANDHLVFDHLFAQLSLFHHIAIVPDASSTAVFPTDSKYTNDIVLEFADLDALQPNGIVIT